VIVLQNCISTHCFWFLHPLIEQETTEDTWVIFCYLLQNMQIWRPSNDVWDFEFCWISGELCRND